MSQSTSPDKLPLTPEQWEEFISTHLDQLERDSQLLLIEVAELSMAAAQIQEAQQRDVYHTLQRFIREAGFR